MKITELNQVEDEMPSAIMPDQVQDLLTSVMPEYEIPEEAPDLSDVELRLEEANCYKALLQNPLFSADAGVIARRVEKRIREYIRTELKMLLGLESPKAIEPKVIHDFGEDEVKALKMLAGKMLSKPVAQDKPKPKEPTVNMAVVEPLSSKKIQPKSSPKVKEEKVTKLKGKTFKTIVNLPDGSKKEVEMPVGGVGSQVMPPKGRIPVNAEASAMQNATAATLNAPQTGLLGTLVTNAVKNGIEE